MALSFQRYDWLREMKEGSSFPPHENNPVFQDKANSCVRVSTRKTSSDVFLEKAKALHRILPESENEFL